MTDESLVSGVVNFRDVGGLPAATGVTRHGVLYRSGHLAALADQRELVALGLRRIIDLRSDEEILAQPSRSEDTGAQTHRVPMFLGSVASFFEDDVTLDQMYRHMVDDAADRVVQVVRNVVAEQPVLVHCTAGKDRTGVTVALALASVGVEDDAVIADYARTARLLPPERNAKVIAAVRAHNPSARNAVSVATESPAPVMRSLLDDIRGRYGSVADYLRAHGISDAELVEWQKVLIETR